MRNNSKFALDQSHNYVVVDFDNVTERGLKSLITALKQAGATVTDVEASNKKTRRDGETVKRAKLFFDNGQSMTLFVGDEGDIYQMTLNNTKQPIPSVKNERELAREMVRLMERNQSKFDKQVARKAAQAVKDTSDIQPATRSIAKRLEEAKAAEQVAQSNYTNALAARDSVRTKLEEDQRRVADLEAALEQEKQETKELEAQLEAANA
ncbi:defense against restriction DarA-related protein [Vibrio diabolicus]|uniref:defense against restriction DarA-related protein n=1 Tax=Vibrio diabolicus TaxID=50719 RepID=UPI0037526090